ncbi:MAG TPA: hypothetical protein VKR22_01065 [Acidimicrobiales bacterium]|nr:hypothetical protein [Acidimicrobiales bacterium]
MASGTVSLLDRHLPAWHFREVHERRIDASPERVWDALLVLTPRATPFGGSMLALRLAPAALAARRWPLPPNRKWLDLFVEFGFVELGRSDSEVALGAVGRFWRPIERLEPLPDAAAFDTFDEPGFAKGAMNFHVAGDAGSVTLTTETRVVGTDDRARRSFRPYWVPVRAIGGLMRREMLAAVARRAAGAK